MRSKLFRVSWLRILAGSSGGGAREIKARSELSLNFTRPVWRLDCNLGQHPRYQIEVKNGSRTDWFLGDNWGVCDRYSGHDY